MFGWQEAVAERSVGGRIPRHLIGGVVMESWASWTQSASRGSCLVTPMWAYASFIQAGEPSARIFGARIVAGGAR